MHESISLPPLTSLNDYSEDKIKGTPSIHSLTHTSIHGKYRGYRNWSNLSPNVVEGKAKQNSDTYIIPLIRDDQTKIISSKTLLHKTLIYFESVTKHLYEKQGCTCTMKHMYFKVLGRRYETHNRITQLLTTG